MVRMVQVALIRLREYLTVTIHRVNLTHQEIIHPGYQQEREEVLQAIETQIKQLHMLRSYEIQVAHHLEVEQIILTHPAIPMGQALHCEMHILVIQLPQDSVVQHQQLETHHQACQIEFKQEWSHSS